jgi:hypothetical protein
VAACHARSAERRLGHGLAAQPSGGTGLRALRARTAGASALSPRTGRRGGALADGSAVARRRQGAAGGLEGVTGKAPGKEEGTKAHRNSGSTVRRCQRRRAAAFVGGEGPPVVAGVAEEVLQLGRGEGVRKLQEIPGIGSSGRSSPGRGGRRRRSAEFREGEAGSGGRRRRSGCGEWRGGSSTRERGRRGVRKSISERRETRGGVRSAAARPRGEKGREEGVPGVGVPRGARGLVGSGPDRRAAPAATRARRGRATCAARARSGGRRQRGRELTCGPAQ